MLYATVNFNIFTVMSIYVKFCTKIYGILQKLIWSSVLCVYILPSYYRSLLSQYLTTDYNTVHLCQVCSVLCLAVDRHYLCANTACELTFKWGNLSRSQIHKRVWYYRHWHFPYYYNKCLLVFYSWFKTFMTLEYAIITKIQENTLLFFF